MAEKIVEVRHLSFGYPDGTVALDDVSLDIYEGESLGIVGGNGAGKSTLLLHLNGILPEIRKDGGSGDSYVNVDGLRVEKRNLERVRARVGILFQNPEDQLFSATLYEDIAFGLRNMGLEHREIEARVNEALERFNLKAYRGKNPFHLSFGEKKLAAIATVYVMKPGIYCLDEPTSNLDPRGRRELIEVLREIKETKVIVTHDLDMVRELCNRVVVMSKGRIVGDGKVDEILGDRELLLRCRLV